MENSPSSSSSPLEDQPQSQLSDDDSREESSSSSGALSPVPTTPQDEENSSPNDTEKPRDASGTFQVALQEEDMTETADEHDENGSRDEETSTLPQHLVAPPEGSPGDDDVAPRDRVPRVVVRGTDPPPTSSRVTSPTRPDVSLSNTTLETQPSDMPPQQEKEPIDDVVRRKEEPSASEIQAPSLQDEPEAEAVLQAESLAASSTMAPELPSLFPAEERESSEGSVVMEDLVVDEKPVGEDEAEPAASLSQQQQQRQEPPQHVEEDHDRVAMPPPPPRRFSKAQSDLSGDHSHASTFYLQPHPLVPSSIPAELPPAPPYLAPTPYGYPVHPGVVPLPPHPGLPNVPYASSTPGRRKIKLRLVQEMDETTPGHKRSGSFLFRRSLRNMEALQTEQTLQPQGTVVVSWFEGTSSLELQEHVRRCVMRKLGLSRHVRLYDMRILDESMDPPEEIVLSAYIPDGSEFLLRFRTRESIAQPLPRHPIPSPIVAPLSPSAAPSPLPSSNDLAGLNAAQLSILGAHLHGLNGKTEGVPTTVQKRGKDGVVERGSLEAPQTPDGKKEALVDADATSKASTDFAEGEVLSMTPEEQIEARLQQLTDLLVTDRLGKGQQNRQIRQEKKQVIFVLANYFVLFLSLIAISAEIQARAPRWMAWMERNLESVQTCASDQDSLYDCVSNGDFSGLIASFILWFGRSAATKRFFLFGFETPKRLWTAVYESLVTAFCWGISYMFIRRGMNPDTRSKFLQRYWKDAVYGSLAGFNASFLKAVLKNLIPQEALEDALQDRQLKILSWLPSFN